MGKRGCLVIAAVVAVAATMALFGVRVSVSGYRTAASNKWKADALAEIDRLTSDTNWVAAEIATLNARHAKDEKPGDNWVSDHLVLMKNGDWIVCAAKCTKADWRIDDIFLGRASDGKWYYSTYHFCTGMIVLRAQGRPENLNVFVNVYFLRGFDGKPSTKIGKTWPDPD